MILKIKYGFCFKWCQYFWWFETIKDKQCNIMRYRRLTNSEEHKISYTHHLNVSYLFPLVLWCISIAYKCTFKKNLLKNENQNRGRKSVDGLFLLTILLKPIFTIKEKICIGILELLFLLYWKLNMVFALNHVQYFWWFKTIKG